MPNRYKSWTNAFASSDAVGELRCTATVKVKRGRPISAIRTSSGYCCLVNLGMNRGHEVACYDSNKKLLHTAPATDLWGNGYIVSSNDGYDVFECNGRSVRRFVGVKKLEVLDHDLLLIDDKTLATISGEPTLGLKEKVGIIRQAVKLEDRLFVVGTDGVAMLHRNGDSYSLDRVESHDGWAKHYRVVPLDQKNLCMIGVSIEKQQSRLYRIDADNMHVHLCGEVNYMALSNQLGMILCSGLLPFAEGVVCYASSAIAPSGDFYFNYRKQTWNELCVPRPGLNTYRRTMCKGFMISMVDDRERAGRYLTVHNPNFEQTYSQHMPTRYPHPSLVELTEVLPDGTIVITDGKLNQEVSFYELS